MEHSPFVSLTLDSQIGCEVKILSEDEREKGARIEIFSTIDQMILTDGLESKDDIRVIEKDQVDIVETETSKVCQNIQLLSAYR
jgi:hypothetical protein